MISASQVYSPLSPLQAERALLEIDRVDVVVDDLGVEALGVLPHALHQRGPCRPSTSPGQLSTSVVVISWPPCSTPGDQQRLAIGARRIHRGAVAGRAGAQDDEAACREPSCILFLRVRIRAGRDDQCAAGYCAATRLGAVHGALSPPLDWSGMVASPRCSRQIDPHGCVDNCRPTTVPSLRRTPS